MIQEPARVRLELPSHPQNVALVRAAVSGLAEATQLSPELTADLKTAVSEACNNVVLHAYEGRVGDMVVEIHSGPDGVSATVSDRGTGIVRIASHEDHMGLGIAVISAVADQSEFRTPDGGGTEVRMWFAHRTADEKPDPIPAPVWAEPRLTNLAGDVVLWFAPTALARPVLGRVFRAVAAAAHFSIDREADLRALNEALASYLQLRGTGGCGIALVASPRRVALTGFTISGALPTPDGENRPRPRLYDVSELERRRAALAGIVQSFETQPLDGHDMLHLVLVDEPVAANPNGHAQ